MDGYLSKPIDVSLLLATVESLGENAALPSQSDPVPAESAPVTFDEAAALGRTSGDRGLLKELIGLYRDDAEVSLRKIAKAITNKDAEALRSAAHALKGSVATVGGTAARHAAARLEQIGKAGHLADAPAVLALLRSEVGKLETALVAARLVSRPRREAKRSRSSKSRRRTRRS
jgi:HPt (histidine-containing phosphotransfer) domain-containing protein